MGKRRKRWLVAALTSVAVAALLVVRWARLPGRSFDPVAWRDEALVRQGVRLQMADRLVARGTLIGRTRAEVVGLLGQPPPTGYFADWDLVYWLSPERAYFSIDSEWLVLRLDADGRVAENRIVRD